MILSSLRVDDQLERSLIQRTDRIQRVIQFSLLSSPIPESARHLLLQKHHPILILETYHPCLLKITGSKHTKSSLKTETNFRFHGLASIHPQGSNGNQLGYNFRYMRLTLGSERGLHINSYQSLENEINWREKRECQNFDST